MLDEYLRSQGQHKPDTYNLFAMIQALASDWEDTRKRYGLDITEEADKAAMMAEAVKRMEMLGLSAEVISKFQADGQPDFAMEDGKRFPLKDSDKEMIQKLESNDEHLVYAVIRNDSCYGRLTNYIMVSRYICDWGLERNSITERNRVMAYVYNHDDPSCSEMGTIAVKHLPNGMLGRRM